MNHRSSRLYGILRAPDAAACASYLRQVYDEHALSNALAQAEPQRLVGADLERIAEQCHPGTDLSQLRETQAHLQRLAGHPRPSHVRVCVAAVVVRAGRVLLVRRGPGAPFDAGWWSPPAGGIEPGDASLVAAAVRELKEEVGLDLVDGRVAGVIDGLDKDGRPFVTAMVVGTCPEGQEPANLEPGVCDELAWYEPEDVPEATWDRDVVVKLAHRAHRRPVEVLNRVLRKIESMPITARDFLGDSLYNDAARVAGGSWLEVLLEQEAEAMREDEGT